MTIGDNIMLASNTFITLDVSLHSVVVDNLGVVFEKECTMQSYVKFLCII